MLPERRRGLIALEGGRGIMDRIGDQRQCGGERVRYRDRHAALAHLGVREYLVELIDGATGDVCPLKDRQPLLLPR